APQPHRTGVGLDSGRFGRFPRNGLYSGNRFQLCRYRHRNQPCNDHHLLRKSGQPLPQAAITNLHRGIVADLWNKAGKVCRSYYSERQSRKCELPAELVDEIYLALILSGRNLVDRKLHPHRQRGLTSRIQGGGANRGRLQDLLVRTINSRAGFDIRTPEVLGQIVRYRWVVDLNVDKHVLAGTEDPGYVRDKLLPVLD